MNLDWHHVDYIPMIIPTLLIPFTFVAVGISVCATFIAGLFGIKLEAEGPKQLLEVLLKPRVIVTALILNGVGYGLYFSYLYVKNLPSFETTIKRKHKAVASDRLYVDQPQRKNNYQVAKDRTAPRQVSLSLAWQTKLPTGSFRGATRSGDSLFIGAHDGYIYELSLQEGKVLRHFFLGTFVSPSPTIYDGKLYSGEGTHYTHHARIYKFDLASGRYEGSYSTKGHTEGEAVVVRHDGQTTLFTVAGKDGLHAIDPVTMTRRWHQIAGHIDGAVRVHDGLVFVGTGREKDDYDKFRTYAVAYDILTGKEVWKNETPLSCWMEPVLVANDVCFVMGEIYSPSDVGILACFNQKTGAPEFSIFNDAPLIGVPLALGEGIIVSDLAGKVCRISHGQRKIQWCHATKAKGIQIAPVTYDRKSHLLFYPTAKDGLYVLDPDNGKLLAHYVPEPKEMWHGTYGYATLVDGAVVTVDGKGHVRKLNVSITR